MMLKLYDIVCLIVLILETLYTLIKAVPGCRRLCEAYAVTNCNSGISSSGLVRWQSLNPPVPWQHGTSCSALQLSSAQGTLSRNCVSTLCFVWVRNLVSLVYVIFSGNTITLFIFEYNFPPATCFIVNVSSSSHKYV